MATLAAWVPQRPARRGGAWGTLARLAGHPSAVLGALIVAAVAAGAVFAPVLAPYAPGASDLENRLAAPSWLAATPGGHWLGTDGLGRDLWSRIIFGSRVSLLVGLAATLLSLLPGLVLGLAAGFYRGRVDGALSRFAELLMAFPHLIFAIGVMAALGPGFWNLVAALAFKGWVEFFRVARGEAMAQSAREYVDAARAVGASSARIVGRHILPNMLHTSLVLGTLRMGHFIVLEASLSFLGLGLPPRLPAWGTMVAEGREVMLTAWWVSTFPGLAIVALVLAVNLVGEGLRDVLDPRLRAE
ncbi:MAG: ABC transporter permease [Armatimonadota bacterium]|nr:ABC transporter permease [Armatimonadota bacterium]MDR7421653.1 ABC transporter permease [Armatimonadota bacterium]MDR7455180.1 ABC transporter permease [Armatimonadota bacterium]MDR7455900.1 ABC transporter permease [Armatimonadota bacterium]